jgi:hypothetical protein
MPPATPSLPDASPLRQRLARLRRRMRLLAVVYGVGWLLVVVLLGTAAAGLLDWRWHLPGLLRAAFLVATLTGAALVTYHRLLRPLAARSDDLALALRVEEQYPHLNDSLASTVQFLEQEGGGDSAALRRAAVGRTLRASKGCDFNRVVDSRGVGAAGAAGLASLAVAVTLVLMYPAQAATALGRFANPFGALDWPRKTKLELEDPAGRIGRRQPYRVHGRVWGVIPDEAMLELAFDRGQTPLRRVLPIRTDGDGVGRLEIHLRPDEVLRSFRFRVTANDAVSPEYSVEVLPPPALVALGGKPSPQVRLRFPRYTDLPSPQDLPPGSGTIDGVLGTAVRLRAAADRPLRRAWVEYRPEVVGTRRAAALAGLAARDGLAAAASLAAGLQISGPVEATLDAERRRLQVDFVPRIHGSYVLHFEDDTGLSGQRQFELRLRPDPAPTVRLERPSATRDVLTVLPVAELPLEVVAEDPQYALRSVWVEYRTRSQDPPRRLVLCDPATGQARDLAPWAGTGVLAAPVPRLRPIRLEFRRALRLADLRHPDGAALRDGDMLTLQAFADDFDDVTANKEPGRSHQVEVRIVGRDALEVVLNQEQNRIQQELARLLEKQREAHDKTTAVEKKLRRGERPSAEDTEKLLQAEQLQQQIRERVGDRKEGLRAEVARLRETLKQNGLRNSAAQMHMDKVARELDRLATKELEQIEPKLANARKLAEMLDKKAREERKAQLGQQIRQAEKEARALEEAAKKDAAAAERAEEQAALADGRDKERKQAEAKRLRQRAQAQREKVRQLRAQAERDRREAAQKADPAQPREALAEARVHQKEVQKTLQDLLADLKPDGDGRQIKAEAVRLLQEQKQQQAELEEMNRKDRELAGKTPDELTPEQKAELENQRDAQRRLEERAGQLLNRMKRLAQQREKAKDPDTARDFREAAEQAEANDLTGKMKQAGEQIRNNKLGKAQQSQHEAVAELEKLVRNLKDRREAELDRLAKKLRKAEKDVEMLMDEQEKLKKKIEEAGKIGDPAKREEALKKLARRQKELQKKTEELVQQLSRLRSERARQALGQATEDMQEAGNQLSRGRKDAEKQEDVLDRLDEARRELERARKLAEEELGREQLDRVADLVRRIKERQEALVREAERIQRDVQQRAGWARGLKSSLLSLGEAQKGLGSETAEVARKELSGAPVFAKFLRQAAESMERAGKRLGRLLKQSPPPKSLPDARLAELQADALGRLQQLLEAFKDAEQAPRPLSRPQGGGGEPGEEGGGPERDGVPPLAQLKLLRAMQKEVNDRTEAFKKKHPDPAALGPKEKAELAALRREQREIADLLEEMMNPGGDKDGGDKMEADEKEEPGDKKEGDD